MGQQRKIGIYIGCDSGSIIRYLEPSTGELFRARFLDCVFDETVFPNLGVPVSGGRKDTERNLTVLPMDHKSKAQDPPTVQKDVEVMKLLNNMQLANEMPDAFNNINRVTKDKYSMMRHGRNLPAKITIESGQQKLCLSLSNVWS